MQYLITHGYVLSAVETIIDARASTTSASDFANYLSQHGLAVTEGLYIWDIIHQH